MCQYSVKKSQCLLSLGDFPLPLFQSFDVMYFLYRMMPQIQEEYLPGHLSPLTASLTTTTVSAPNPAVCKSVSHTIAWDMHMADKTLGGISLLIAEIQSANRKKPNVQSTRTSVMHLLQAFWFMIDLGAAQHLCCWPPNIVQGHFDSRCWGGEAFLIYLLTARTLSAHGGFKPETPPLATSSFL